MFLIMGISPGEKKLDFQQTIICECCGQYGRIEIYFSYMAFSLFFIPLFKWNKRYLAKASCCSCTSEIDPEVGRRIAKGELTRLAPTELRFSSPQAQLKSCPACGYSTDQDFQFCPKCGRPLSF